MNKEVKKVEEPKKVEEVKISDMGGLVMNCIYKGLKLKKSNEEIKKVLDEYSKNKGKGKLYWSNENNILKRFKERNLSKEDLDLVINFLNYSKKINSSKNGNNGLDLWSRF